jgi:hypothetical protein
MCDYEDDQTDNPVLYKMPYNIYYKLTEHFSDNTIEMERMLATEFNMYESDIQHDNVYSSFVIFDCYNPQLLAWFILKWS